MWRGIRMPVYAVVVGMIIVTQGIRPCGRNNPEVERLVEDTAVPGNPHKNPDGWIPIGTDTLFQAFQHIDSSRIRRDLPRRLGDPVGYYGCDRRPKRPVLYQNYPNPFKGSTAVAFYLPWALRVRIVIYNTLGREVITLVDDIPMGGDYEVAWDGCDDKGNPVPSGVYFCRMVAGWTVYSIKLVRAR